ncbi:MAG TPA: S8 family serine peptidase [Vicinamibacterales bacterium]|nr:S8 family serine peptidase [Vicinamibacterales bacterium]
MSIRRRARAHAAAFIGGALWLATVAAQDLLPNAGRRSASPLAVTAIDGGLHSSAAPRAALKATDSHTRRMPASGRYVRGSVIVKFRAGTSAARKADLVALVAGRSTPSLPYAEFDLVAVDPAVDPEAVASRLSAQPDVAYAQARYRVRPLFRPNDPLYGLQWNFTSLDMERAWDINPGSSPSVTVAVLDSGMAYTNVSLQFVQFSPQTIDGVVYPALGTASVPFAAAPELGASDRFVSPYDFIWDDPQPVDLHGHGTHVAGTIGQVTNNAAGVAGIAFNVKLMPVKVIDGFWDEYFESPFFGTDDVVARGIRYAVDNGAKVINLSIGRDGPPAPAVREAVQYAVGRGAFLAVAGGNEFLEGNPVARFAEFAQQINGMVSVGAIGSDRQRATYSSTGPYIELVAPGGDFDRGGVNGMILQQTYDFDFTDTFLNGAGGFRPPRFDVFAYIFAQGTSMSTAHVSGLAALLYQQGITKPSAIEAAMKRSATDLGPAGRDDQYGHGLINARAALRGLGIVR